MATTITSADLTVTVTETITINGQSMGSSNTKSFLSTNDPDDSIKSVYKRIISVPTSGEVVLWTAHASDVSGSQLDKDLIVYSRVTNKDDTNFISLRLTTNTSEEFVYSLASGESFLLHNQADCMGAAAGAAGAADAHIFDVSAQADTSAVDVEIFVASK